MMDELKRLKELAAKNIIGTAGSDEKREIYAYFERELLLIEESEDSDLIMTKNQAE